MFQDVGMALASIKTTETIKNGMMMQAHIVATVIPISCKHCAKHH